MTQPGITAAAAASIQAQQAATTAIRNRILAIITSIWRGLPDYRSPDQFAGLVVPIITAGQQQIASTTAAYLSIVYGHLIGAPVQMLGVSPDTVSDLRNGVTPTEVYRRPFQQVWSSLADAQEQRAAHFDWTGPSDEHPSRPLLPPESWVQDSIDSGEARAISLASTDLQLAKTHAAQEVLGQQEHVVGFRRVLEGAYSCGLCIISATRRYHKAGLLPIHPACDCSIAPIVGDHDPGEIINLPMLQDGHQAISDTFGKANSSARWIDGQFKVDGSPLQYRDVLIEHEHGEIGPVIAVRGQHFTGPTDLPNRPNTPGEHPLPDAPPEPTAQQQVTPLPDGLPESAFDRGELERLNAKLPEMPSPDALQMYAQVNDPAVRELVDLEIKRRRAAITEAFAQKLPPKPAGLINRGLDTLENDIAAVNRGYDTGESRWRNNCTNCVTALELRRRGYNVTAAPRVHGRPFYETPGAWLANPSDVPRQSWAAAEKAILQFGDGARGAMSVGWRAGGGHIFSWVVEGRKIVWIDPQPGKIDRDGTVFIDQYRKLAVPSVSIFRMDTLPLGDVLRNYLG